MGTVVKDRGCLEEWKKKRKEGGEDLKLCSKMTMRLGMSLS